jgi:hypothetical protein
VSLEDDAVQCAVAAAYVRWYACNERIGLACTVHVDYSVGSHLASPLQARFNEGFTADSG